MESKPLDYYMGLDYTVEMTREQDILVARVRELPGCVASIGEDEPVGQLWDELEEAKKRWLEGAIRKQRWIPEPPRVEEDELRKLSEFFEEAGLDAHDARAMLYEKGIELYPIPLLQEMWLRELSSEGIYRVGSSFPTAPKTDSSRETPNRALAGDVVPVPLGKSGRVAWLRLDGERSERGYREIEVLDQPIITETATISALTILEATEMEKKELERVLKRVRRAINEPKARTKEPGKDTLNDIFAELLKEWYANQRMEDFSFAQVRTLKWSLALLRYRRSRFDSLPFQEQVALFERHCEYVNKLLEASRKHTAFVEYGTPKGIGTRNVERVREQIKATVLDDVEGLNHREIAEIMGLFIPRDYEINKAVPQVRKLVENGRNLLQRALGGSWNDHAQAMKSEASRFASLSEEEREVERVSDRTGFSTDKVRSLRRSSKGRTILKLAQSASIR